MSRILVHVEGQTEEDFVNSVLGPHLVSVGYSTVSARLIGNVRQRSKRGGVRGWPEVRRGIVNHLKADRECFATTMVDYYGLPQGGDKGWPGRRRAVGQGGLSDPQVVEDAILADVVAHMPKDFDRLRFVPFVTMHEFEGLLFSDCSQFAKEIGRPQLAGRFQEIRDGFQTPEEIDDSPETAPSKRVGALVPGYQKPLMGVLAASAIGLDMMRAECPHFRGWLERLEKIVAPDGPWGKERTIA